MLLDGKTVIVSGAGPGLGRRIALAARRDGANVVLGARTAAYLSKTADEIDPSGERVAWAVTDVTDPATCEALAALAVERFGGVDGLVNCAAHDPSPGGLESADWSALRAAVEVNLVGTLAMTRAALPALKEGGGSVVLITGETRPAPHPHGPRLAHTVSKGGLAPAAHALAHELGPHRIRVNSVAPGWMWGPQAERFVGFQAQAAGTSAHEVMAELVAPMALPEMASDSDVAETVVFLLSDRAKAVTGQTLYVNAGDGAR